MVGDAVRPQATARGRLRRAQLASVLRSALSALRAAVEQQAAIADKIAAAIRVGRPDAAPAKPQGYDGAAMHILADMTPPRQRPRDHVVRTELEEPKPPQPPAKDPQILALEGPVRLVVQAWLELERTEAKTLAAQDWREWSKAWDGLKALGTAIKREKALDELLRLRGEEFGVGQTTHLGLVLQGTEAEVVWALKQDPSADARSTHSPSQSPNFGP